MQSTILFLQQELKTAKDTVGNLEEQLTQLRNTPNKSDCNDDETVTVVPANNSSETATITAASEGKPQLSHSLTNGDTQQLPAPAATNNTDNDTCDNKQSTLNVDDERTIGALQPIILHALRRSDDSQHQQSSRLIVRTNGNVTEQADSSATSSKDTPAGERDVMPVNGTVTAQPNGKRSFDEACNDENTDTPTETMMTTINTTTAAATATVQMQNAKKLRRSSVLSLDLNEEDSRIDCDDERTLPADPNDKTATAAVLATCNGLTAAENVIASVVVVSPGDSEVQ